MTRGARNTGSRLQESRETLMFLDVAETNPRSPNGLRAALPCLTTPPVFDTLFFPSGGRFPCSSVGRADGC